MGKPFNPGFDARSATSACGARGWKPLEIAAIVLGFAFYWPIGLGLLGLKFWQKKSGYQGDVFAFAREKWNGAVSGNWSGAGGIAAKGWRGPSGNRAFDEWRAGELARLEEERRRLVAAERDFAAFMDNLRHARDREEFDRFMQERRAAQGTTSV